MKIILHPSLERLALTSISATLWKIWWSPHIVGVLHTDVPFPHPPKIDFEKAKNIVKESVRKLIIPENLKEKLSEFSDAVGSQIESWLNSHVHRWGIVDKNPETFAWTWTSFGTIDLLKTANWMVCNNAIDINSRFKLACFYCLEEHISTFFNWDKKIVGDRLKVRLTMPNFICTSMDLTRLISDVRHYFWGKQIGIDYNLDVDHPPGCSPIELFEKSLKRSGLCVAAKFFYLKSLERQNNETVVPIMNRALKEFCENNNFYYDLQDAEILCFLLNNMNEDQQVQVLNSAPLIVLGVFLKWPWHALFIKFYQLVGHLLTVMEFNFLLKQVIAEKKLSSQHGDYEQIFIHMWQKASVEFRNFVYTNNNDVCDYFENLSKHENWYACNLLLEGASVNKKMEMVHSAKEYFQSLFSGGKWDKIECFLKICNSSDLELNVFRDGVPRHSNFPLDTKETDQIRINILNAYNAAYEKRCAENSESEPNRFRSAEP